MNELSDLKLNSKEVLYEILKQIHNKISNNINPKDWNDIRELLCLKQIKHDLINPETIIVIKGGMVQEIAATTTRCIRIIDLDAHQNGGKNSVMDCKPEHIFDNFYEFTKSHYGIDML